MKEPDLIADVKETLKRLPDESGGVAVVLATAGSPPAVALLSTGDVHIAETTVRVGIHGSSSVVERLDGGFTLLVPLRKAAARVEVINASARLLPPLAMIEGTVHSVRPTSEPPWVLEMTFSPEPFDHPAIPRYLEYWSHVKRWLMGEIANPPDIPSF